MTQHIDTHSNFTALDSNTQGASIDGHDSAYVIHHDTCCMELDPACLHILRRRMSALIFFFAAAAASHHDGTSFIHSCVREMLLRVFPCTCLTT